MAKANKPRPIGRLALFCLLTAALLGCSTAQPVNQSRLFDNRGVYSLPRDECLEFFVEVQASEGLPAFAGLTGKDRVDGAKPNYPVLAYGSGLGSAEAPVAALVQLKGNSAYRAQYRSFKLSLLDAEARFMDQRSFALYKSPDDPTKLSLRLYLDAFSRFDDMVSVSAGFVHLHVLDAAQGGQYEDYGLYTMAEQLNAGYLKRHGLDRYGALYEAKNFGFDYAAWLALDEAARESALERNNGADDEKLEAMLRGLAGADDFEAAFERYFDRDNYLTYLAGCILLGNRRAALQDFQLYSPADSEKWYLFPAPTDAVLLEIGDRRRRGLAEEYYGLGMLEPSLLHRRFLESAANRKALMTKVEELRLILSGGALAELCGAYKKALAPSVGRQPDYGMLPASPQATEARIDRIPTLVEENYRLFVENFDRPAPFAFGESAYEAGGWRFRWQDASRPGESLSWQLTLSADLQGRHVLFSGETQTSELWVESLPEGPIYAHLCAYNGGDHMQLANSMVEDAAGTPIWGCRAFWIDGEAITGG